MDMNGSQKIEASRETVYAALNDVEILAVHPGLRDHREAVRHPDERKGTLKVGPVNAPSPAR